MKIPNAVVNLIQTIQQKFEHPHESKGKYFGRLHEFFDVAVQSARACFNCQSHTPWFAENSFKEKTIRSFLSILNDKIKEAFSISEQLKSFTSIDPATFPKEAKDLTNFGDEGITSLPEFYGQKVKLNSVVIPSLVRKDTLPVQYKILQTFLFKTKWNGKTNKKQHQLILSNF